MSNLILEAVYNIKSLKINLSNLNSAVTFQLVFTLIAGQCNGLLSRRSPVTHVKTDIAQTEPGGISITCNIDLTDNSL